MIESSGVFKICRNRCLTTRCWSINSRASRWDLKPAPLHGGQGESRGGASPGWEVTALTSKGTLHSRHLSDRSYVSYMCTIQMVSAPLIVSRLHPRRSLWEPRSMYVPKGRGVRGLGALESSSWVNWWPHLVKDPPQPQSTKSRSGYCEIFSCV